MAGLDEASSGRVLLDGAPVAGPGADRGMVFQSYTLFPWLTVLENIAFGLRERGMAPAERTAIAESYIERMGLAGFEHHYPKSLSGGMQQRTALARALANDPKILLLDEPFGALDHQTRSLMQELLLQTWEAQRKTVLFVTHDIDEAIFMANRVAVFSARPGRIKTDVAIDLAHPRHYTVKTTRALRRVQGAAHRGDPGRGGAGVAGLRPREATPAAPASSHVPTRPRSRGSRPARSAARSPRARGRGRCGCSGAPASPAAPKSAARWTRRARRTRRPARSPCSSR